MRVRLLTMCLCVVLVSACGGGGGGKPLAETPVSIGYVVDHTNNVVAGYEAELPVHAFQLAESTFVLHDHAWMLVAAAKLGSIPDGGQWSCQDGGSVTVAVAAPGDESGPSTEAYLLTYEACNEPSFSADASGQVQVLLTAVDESSWNWQWSSRDLILRQFDGDVRVVGEFTADVTETDSLNAHHLKVTNGALRYRLGRFDEVIQNLTLTRRHDLETDVVQLSLNGRIVSALMGGYYLANTVRTFAHVSGRPPHDGYAEFTGARGAAVRLSHRDQQAALMTVDSDGDGVFESGDIWIAWSQLVEGHLWGAEATTNEPPSNPGRFSLSQTVPMGGSTVPVDQVFEFTFNELIDANGIDSDAYAVVVRDGNGASTPVPFTSVVDGNVLTVTPDTQLGYGATYVVNLRQVRSANGDFLSTSDQAHSYQSEPYPNRIDIGHRLNAIVISSDGQRMWGIDQVNRLLTEVDLVNKVKVRDIDLNLSASDLCVDESANEVLIVNENSSFLTRVDLISESVTNEIAWASIGADRSGEDRHFHIRCTASEVYLVDAAWAPALHVLSRGDNFSETDHTAAVEGIGDLIVADGGDTLFTWYQFGWGAGLANSRVVRFDRAGDSYIEADRSTLGYPQHNRDPIASKLFLAPDGSRVINKRHIFNAANLSQVHVSLDEGEVIQAVDWTRNRAASHTAIYDLRDYRVIGAPPSRFSDHSSYGPDGTLYQVVNRDSAIWVLPAD